MFYIIEQGSRIQTPLESLVRNKGVNAIEASAASSAITAQTDTYQRVTSSKYNKLPKAYQQPAKPKDQTREPAVFAEQVMTHPVMAVKHGESLFGVWAIFNQQRFHHLPIIDDNDLLCGIVTDRDLMRFSLNQQRVDLNTVTVSEVMTKAVITAAIDTEIRSIADVMCRQEFSAMPITDEHKKMLGIVSRSDILRTLVNQAPLEMWV